jgi:hypothetical protein
MLYYFWHCNSVLHLCKNDRAGASHHFAVSLHNTQGRTNSCDHNINES